MEIQPLALPGLKLLTPKRLGDARGNFSETYNVRGFAQAGIHQVFVQDNQSLSAQTGTVRGLHFQRPPHAQAKLIRVLRGRILDVTVDLRHGSPAFGQHVAVELSEQSGQQLFVPAGFAHGYCTLEPMTEIFYKVTDYYAAECDTGIRWNDPALGIAWPTGAGAQLSDRDRRLPLLSEIDSPFAFREES